MTRKIIRFSKNNNNNLLNSIKKISAHKDYLLHFYKIMELVKSGYRKHHFKNNKDNDNQSD